MEKTVIAHRRCLTEPASDPADIAQATRAASAPTPVDDADVQLHDDRDLDGSLDACGRPRRLVARSIERFEAVQSLRAQGMSIRAICRALALDRKTVRRFADAAHLDELLFKATHRVSKLDPFTPYLDHRIGEGCANAALLFGELKAHGYTGSEQTVRRYLRPLRLHRTSSSGTHRATVLEGKPAPPKPRRVAAWIMTNPVNLKEAKAMQLKQILTRCPELDALTRHVAAFASMMIQRRGDQLNEWIAAAAVDDLPALHSMLIGLRRDLDAVHNGLTLPYSSGAVEGHVNRIKMLKRQMFGRANFDLLRKRILLAT